MKKEEILELSRRENEGGHDEMELAAFGTAAKAGMMCGGIVCMLLVLLSEFLFHVEEIAIVGWLVYFAMHCSNSTVMYVKLKTKAMLARAIATFIATIAFTLTLFFVSLG